MACPNQGILNKNLLFTIVTLDNNDNPIWADSTPTYTVYEDSISISNIVPGLNSVDMVEDDDTLGLYNGTIDLDNTLFESYRDYKIKAETTIDGSSFSKIYTFTVVEEMDVIDQELETTVNTIASFKGKFGQGDTPVLHIKITTFDGRPIDPYSITCTISGPVEASSLEQVVNTQVPFHPEKGFYVYEWQIDSDQTPGTYIIDWEYYVDEIEKHEYQNAMVVKTTDAPAYYGGRLMGFRAALEHHVLCAQSIPIYYEQAKPSRDMKTFEFSFQKWNQSAGVRVYKNEVLASSNMEIDYDNGKVVFNDALASQEVVNIDYNFKWFSDDELNRFLMNAIETVNIFPPATGYSIENVPDRFIPTVLYGAAKDALRQLMMCLQFQQPAQVFGGIEEAKKSFANFETIKQNYEKDWEKMLEQKKYGPYPSSRMVVTPEYTLPGGRSRWFRYLFK